MAVTFDPILGKLRKSDKGLTEYENSDPTAASGDVWVRKNFTTDGDSGVPRGLLLALTYSGDGVSTYQLSYKNQAGDTLRTTLS